MPPTTTLPLIAEGATRDVRPRWRNPWRQLSRRRRWGMIAVAVVVLAVAGRGVYVSVAIGADTLAMDKLNVFRAQPGDKTGIETIRNALGDDHVVDYQRGGTFLVDLRLANTGGRDVKVERIPAERYYYFKIDRVLVHTDRHGLWDGEFKPFSPFTLKPGEARRLEVRFAFPDCDLASEGTRSIVRGLPVVYSLLGQPRAPVVEFDEEALSVKASGVCDAAFDVGS
jgi:hypothetical protein